MRSYEIPKKVVLEAFKKVKENRGAEGIDEVSLKEFEADLDNNLYKIWNRMSSGSYFPPPVKAIEIEKKSGGKRVLGIPTVGDRVAQMVAKIYLNPLVDPHFLCDLRSDSKSCTSCRGERLFAIKSRENQKHEATRFMQALRNGSIG